MLLQETIERFLLSLEANGRAERTISTYRWRLTDFQRFVEPEGLTSVETLDPERLDAWAVSLRRHRRRWSDHPTRPAEPGGLSVTSIAGRIQAVKTFLAWCVRRGYLERSPAEHLEKPALDLAAENRVMAPADLLAIVAQAEKLTASASRLALRDLALVSFIYETGCRPGEAINLRLDALRLETHEAVVRGKTGRRRVLFAGAARVALENWLAARPECECDQVFVSRTGTPLTISGLYQVFKRLAKGAGIEGRYNPQAVRHLVGQTFTNGANLELARDKLGHSSVVTTARFYAHQNGERLRKATRQLSLLDDGSETTE